MSKFTQSVIVIAALIVSVATLDAFFQSQNFYTVGVRNKLTLLSSTSPYSYIDASVAGSYIQGNAAFATIDSFTTTALLDTVTMTGADVGDLILVTPYTPLYSSTPDSNYQYFGRVNAANTVVVGRIANGATNDPKSGGQFAVFRIEL